MDKVLTQFLAVAETGSLSGAAAQLHVTQPTLSFNINKLETQTGAPLFERSSRGMRLTRYGQTLYENVRLMQRLYDNTLSAIEEQRRGVEQGLAIGTGYSWWTLFLKDMVVDYQAEFPGSPVTVSLGDQLRLLDQVLSGDISLFLATELEGLRSMVGIDFLPFTRTIGAYFVRKGHPLAGKPRSQTEIDAFPLVTSAPPDSRHARFFDPHRRNVRAETVFDNTRFAFSSNSLAACIDYTLATDGVLSHSQAMAAVLAERGLIEVAQTKPPRASSIGIYVLKERRGEDRIEALIGRIMHAAHAVLPAWRAE